MAIYFPSFCWGRHTSTNKNKTVTLELGTCSDMENPPVVDFPWQVMGSTWLFHGSSRIYVGKSSQLFSNGKSRHIMPWIHFRWDTSKPPSAPSQLSWRMAAWWPGAIPAVVGTSAASKIRFETCRTTPWSHGDFNGKPVPVGSREWTNEVPKHIVGRCEMRWYMRYVCFVCF